MSSIKWSSYNILQSRGLLEVAGTYGVEVEVEGRSLPVLTATQWGNKGWKVTKDGSLRGEENAEYVFKGPVDLADAYKRIDWLWDTFKSANTVIDDSNRTSVHVHVNCQQFYLDRLASFGIFWFCFEDVLTEFCGDHRVGNLFCLRASDAPNIVTEFIRVLRFGPDTRINERYHYANWNIEALQKFGSIEIRTMRGTPDKETLQFWLAIIDKIYRASEKYQDPREAISLFSAYGPRGFFTHVFEELSDNIIQALPDHCRQHQWLESKLYEGVRMAQPIAYCVDWDSYEKLQPTDDPFNRNHRHALSFITAKMGEQSNTGPGLPSPVSSMYTISLDTLSSTSFLSSPEPEYHEEDEDYYNPEPEYIEGDDLEI